MTVADFKRPKLELPNGAKKLLLHSCCAPCSGEVMEALQASGIDYTIFFYNPNIHPQKEYLIRKDENIRFAKQHGVPFIDADYDTDNWFERAKGMEWEPERGIRCTMCFDMRFERTALYAAWAFHAGKICSRLTTVDGEPSRIIRAWCTGIITGESRAALPA